MELSKQSVNDFSVSDMFLAKGDMALDHISSTETTLDHQSVHVEVNNITAQIIGLEGQKLNLHVPSESIIEPVSPVEVMLEENALSLMTHKATQEKPTGPDDPNDSQVQSTLSDHTSSDPGIPNEMIAASILESDINPVEPRCEFIVHTDPSEAQGPSDKVTLDPSALLMGKLKEVVCEKKQTPDSTSMTPKDVGCSKEEKSVRKNIPPKKDRMDPLKIDMTRSTVIPLTSSQLSLQCLECHIIFSDNKSKERHLKMNHPTEYEQCMLGDALFACYVCDRHFTCSTELMAHQRAHTEKQPFKCPICGEAFSRSSELTSHKKVHFGKHGYTCSDCGKHCKTLTLLKYHQRIHTGERPYVCIHKECGKRFSMPKALQKHLEAHEKEDTEGTADLANSTTNTKKKRNKGTFAKKFACSQCDESFKTAKSQIHHIKIKHPQCKTIPPSSTTVASQELKGVPLVTTQSAIVQPPLLRMEAIGPAAQQIGPLGAEQIKRLIEKLGNVQKVNQLVILGVDPLSFQAQNMGMQQPQGLIQPLHFNFTQPTIQPVILQQTRDESRHEGMMSTGAERTTCKDSLEIGVTVEQEATMVQGEKTVVSLGNPENQVAVVESDMRGAQLNEVQFEILPELTEKSVLTPQEESSEQMDTTVEQHIQVTLDVKTLETGDGSSVFSINDFESSQSQTTEENISKPTEIMLSEETIITAESLDQKCDAEDSLIESEPQSGQMNILNFDNNQELEAHLEQLAPKETSQSEEPKGQTIQPSLNNVQHHQENYYLEQAPVNNSGNQQTMLAPGDQKMSGVKDCLYAKIMLPTKKKRSKKRVSLKSQSLGSEDEGSLSTSQTTTSRETNTASKTVQKKREKTKNKKLVHFGPRENKEKSSKQKLLKISKAGLYKEWQDIDLVQVPTLLQNESAPHLKQKQKNQKRKKGGTVENLTGLKHDFCIPKAIKVAEPTPQGKPQKRKIETPRDLAKKGKSAQDMEQNETPKPKKKKQAKIVEAVSPKKAKIKDATENELGTEIQTLAKRKDKEQKSESEISCHDQIKQQALLLLKGHKQPQLKVHKLDAKTTGFEQPLKHKCQSKEVCSQEATVVQTKGETQNKSPQTARKKKAKMIGKKSKEFQKDACHLQMYSVDNGLTSAPLCTKPKVVRKRKSSTKIDQEIALSPPYSRLTIGCQDCGKNFSEVPALQEHMASMHSESGIFQSNLSSDASNNPVSSGSNEAIITKAVHSSNFEIQVSTDWDMETEMREIGLEDRDDHGLSFPALSPSPSFPTASISLEHEAKEREKIHQDIHPGNSETLCKDSTIFRQPFADVSSTEPDTFHIPVHKKKSGEKENMESVQLVSVSEPQEGVDIKEELPLDVKVVMVEDQNVDDKDSTQVNSLSNETRVGSDQQENESVHTDLNQCQLSIQHVNPASTENSDSHLTEQPEIKQEEEEILVQREEKQTKTSMTRSRRGRGGRSKGKRQLGRATKRATKEMVNNKEECQVVFQLYSLTDDCEEKNEERNNQTKATCSTIAYKQSELEECPEDQVVLELESVTSCAVDVRKPDDASLVQKSGEQDKTSSSSGMVLEHFQTAHESEEGNSAHSQGSIRSWGNPHPETEGITSAGNFDDVKIEASPSTLAPHEVPPSERDLLKGVRMFRVKAENHQNLNEHKASQQTHRAMCLPEKHLNHATDGIPSGSSTGSESAGKQCIFYPVKEEEGEILVEPPLSEQATKVPEERTEAGPEIEECEEIMVECSQMEMHHNFYGGTEEGDLGTEHQSPQHLLEFLSQSSDTEEFDNFQSEPDAEALIMSCYHGIHTNGAMKQKELSVYEEGGRNSGNVDFSQAKHQGGTTKECWKPIDYFLQYFNWDTWKEIAVWTGQTSKLPTPVTEKEVAQIAGIHIAMGTLKFPSMKLYWEDLTRVPLIADAMSASKFSELTYNLKLASPRGDLRQANGDGDEQCGQGNTTQLSTSDKAPRQVPSPGDKSRMFTSLPLCRYQDTENCTDTLVSKTDPLWKVQAIVKRVQEGCRALKRNGNHAVDQYPLPFQRHPTHLLHHTIMINVTGLVMDFNLRVKDCKREEVVVNMVSQEIDDNQGMVFLCKPELSTPSMLEHLLEAGVRSAGKVGGARGQVGDEFVTSDGKLKLFRCHHGFILSAATKERSRSTSLVSGFERAIKAANLNRDLRSLYRTPCTSSSPSAWPQSVLWDLIDLALVNSWLQYKQDTNHDSEPLSLMAFRLEVSKALILSSSIDAQDSSPPYPPVPKHSAPNTTPGTNDAFENSFPDAATRYDGMGHWPEQLAEGEEARCRFGGCERTSRVRCLKCCVFLCISRNHNCFLKFHSQGSE
ncbi:uncharacterized protein LOC113575613 isoform X2 [Electrophorus electricus]|uniref:uncharacterized protein LOC113575613 isoform X2 n=1 Tax=Electrophorus electricus TaxID=8005 RepID=UPI0015D0B6C3|nr:uncharacterized protein LOC113575613 isoform X2 [Electrophorus electricus]